MIYILHNAGPILAATLAGLGFGWGWTALLGNGRWSAGTIALTFVAQAWLAAILAGALILAPKEAGAWTMALGTAFIIWIGFVAPALAVTLGRRGLGSRAVLAEWAFWLGTMLVQAAVLQAIGVAAPPGPV